MQPSVPSIPTIEGGGVRGNRGTGTNSGGGGIVGSGARGGDGSGSAVADLSQVAVCLELTSGNLQRNVSVNVITLSSPISTGF